MDQQTLQTKLLQLAPAKVCEFVERGELWRAKEILQSRISGGPADVVLFESYGLLLLLMHDELEAGKYLFVSGQKDDMYRSVIELYLSRHARAHVNRLCSTFPKSLRNEQFQNLPATVKEFLLDQGYRFPETKPISPTKRVNPYSRSTASVLGCCFFLWMIVTFCVGLIATVQFIFQISKDVLPA